MNDKSKQKHVYQFILFKKENNKEFSTTTTKKICPSLCAIFIDFFYLQNE